MPQAAVGELAQKKTRRRPFPADYNGQGGSPSIVLKRYDSDDMVVERRSATYLEAPARRFRGTPPGLSSLPSSGYSLLASATTRRGKTVDFALSICRMLVYAGA